MSFSNVGLHNVGSFQVSGIPYASSSINVPGNASDPVQVGFPYVTKFVTIRNVTAATGSLRVGFSANGVKNGSNYFVLSNEESYSGEWKLTSVFLLSDSATPMTASIVAGLTEIYSSSINNSVINNWSGSQGVG